MTAPTSCGRKSIGDLLGATIEERGVEAAIRQYRELKSTQPDSYDFGEWELNDLGQQLLEAKKLKDAIQILELNAEVYPPSWWAYDELGEAYMGAGEKESRYQKLQEVAGTGSRQPECDHKTEAVEFSMNQ